MRKGNLLYVLLLVLLSYVLLTVVDSASLRGDHDPGSEEKPVELHVVPVPVQKSRAIAVLDSARQAAFKGGFYAALAGIAQVLSLMWLRTTMNYQYRYGVPLITAIQQLYQQGGITRFYKGLSFAIIIGPLSKFGATAANEGSRVLIESMNLLPGAAELYSTVLGTIFAILWRIFLMPIETCKTVLQVDGGSGFDKLVSSVRKGNWGVLYRGSTATVLAVAISHYPWFFTYNLLDKYLQTSTTMPYMVGRSAVIGFTASAVADTISNFLRVLKTVKQSMNAEGKRTLSYLQIARNVLNDGGIGDLFGRGLLTRVLTNGVQSVLFVVLWKGLPLWWAHRKQQHHQLEGDQQRDSTHQQGTQPPK